MDPELYKGAKKGDFSILEQHRDQLEVQVTPNNNSVLHVFAQFNNIDSSIVTDILGLQPLLLLKVNAKLETALHIAARQGHNFTVQALIDFANQVADVESGIGMAERMLRMINKDGNTALHEAVWNSDHLNVVELLVDQDPQYSHPANNAGETPLYIAAERGFDGIVSEILNTCTSPSYSGPDGLTPLHAAVFNDFEGCTTQLLAQEESLSLIKKSDIHGWTPLHYAARLGHLKRVKQLLEQDKSVAYCIAQEDNNKTALHVAAIHGKTKVIELLISQCPDCWEIVDSKGHNILHLACIYRRWKVINFIREDGGLGGLINQKDEEGNTPLHLLAAFAPTSIDNSDFLRFLRSRIKEKSYMKLLASDNHPSEGEICTLGMFMDSRVDKGAFNKEQLNPIDLAYQKIPHHDDRQRISIDEAIVDIAELFARKEELLVEHLAEAGTLRGSRNLVKFDNDRIEKLLETRERESQPLPRDFRKMGDTMLIVAAFIATVTFAAGFTIPGGLNGNEGPNQGMAVLTRAAAFKAFVVTDSLAMGFSTGAVFLLLICALRTNPAKIKNLFTIAILLLACASVAMVIAFMSSIYAVLLHSPGLAISECVIIGFGLLLFYFTVEGDYKCIKLF